MKKYIKPNIKIKKVKLNYFLVRRNSNFNNIEIFLAATYTCRGTKVGECGV